VTAGTDRTYELGADGRTITCRLCGLTSHHSGDVEKRYCGNCHIFHEDVAGKNYEFDCVECGRHIFLICGPPTTRCAACETVPGWWNNPEIAAIIDPDHSRKPRVLQ
jgi:ribosomal protein L37E